MSTSQGFTLIELLIVISIIGILSAVLIPNLVQARIQAERIGVRAYIRHCTTTIEDAREIPELRIPTSITSCQDNLLANMISRPSYVKTDKVTIDPLGDAYIIEVVDKNGRTYSYDGNSVAEH